MKALFALILTIISFQSFACEEQVTDWTADKNSNPWAMDSSKSASDGYWAYINPYRCGTVDSPKHWRFIELKGSKLEREVKNVKAFGARQELLAKAGAKPSKYGPDKMCLNADGNFSAYAEEHYHSYKNELQYKVKFMVDNGHLTMEDYKLPECPF
tara:strand:+ start:907 stop:1374 length:468 start_codon:yes stop_codon:yes gene_type:complete